jgi:hypothetical protein
MSTNESNNIARVVAEMSAATTSRSDRDWKKAQKAAQQERIDEQVEAARLVAKETLDERDQRWREYNDSNLGKMNSSQYREFVMVAYGFDPGV